MVMINLLPDLRKAKLREQNTRQLAISVASATVIVSVAAIVVLVLVTQAQALQIRLLTNSISDKQAQIKREVPAAQDIATAQQHLASLAKLYGQRPSLSKFFTVLESVANSDIALNSVSLDATNKLTVNGQAKNYQAASRLAEAMQASNIEIGANASPSNTPDFSNVLLSGLGSDQSGKVSFTITAQLATGVTRGN